MTKTLDDVFSEEELEAIEDTRETKREYEERQQEFLDKLSQEESADVVAATTTLAEGLTVDVTVELSGEFEETLADMETVAQNIEDAQSLKDLPELTDRACQTLADVVDDPALDKQAFYAAYQEFGSETLGTMLRRVFESVEQQRKRDMGEVDGFRGQ